MTKEVLVIFDNLRGCDGHLLMQEISKFGLEIDVIPNGLENYMTFITNIDVILNLIFLIACNL